MGFTRKWLSALGIEADKIEEIVSAHVEVIDGIKKERDALQASLDKLDEEKKNLISENEQLKKNDSENYNKLKKEFDDYKADVLSKETLSTKQQAYSDLLRSAGVSEKRINAIIKVTDLDALTLKDGKIADESAQLEKIKADWAEFIETKTVQGAKTSTPPTNVGGNVAKTKEEILQIKDTTERQKAWLDYLNNKGDK